MDMNHSLKIFSMIKNVRMINLREYIHGKINQQLPILWQVISRIDSKLMEDFHSHELGQFCLSEMRFFSVLPHVFPNRLHKCYICHNTPPVWENYISQTGRCKSTTRTIVSSQIILLLIILRRPTVAGTALNGNSTPRTAGEQQYFCVNGKSFAGTKRASLTQNFL